MSTTIVKWEIFCDTENKYVYVYLDAEAAKPIRCPNSVDHSITESRTAIIGVIQQNEVIIKEESVPTQGYFRTEGKTMTCAANTDTNQVTDLEYPISALAFYISPDETNYNDTVNVYVEVGDIGVVTSAIVTGTNLIPITTPVFNNIPMGFEILIDNILIGEVIGKDNINYTLTMTANIAQDFATNAVISLRNRMVKNFTIGKAPLYALGLSKIGSSYVSKDYFIMVEYTNKSLVLAKEFIYYTEYTY